MSTPSHDNGQAAPENAWHAPSSQGQDAPPAADAAAPAPGGAQDPYAAYPAQQPGASAGSPGAYGTQESPYGAPQGAAAPDPFAASQGPGQQGPEAAYGAPHGQPYAPPQGQPFAGQAQGQPGGTQFSETPPPGTKGVFAGPLSGQPTTPGDARTWAMLAQLSVVIGHVVSIGFLGWVGPLIVFLMYKDRSRFVRFHAAEALNGAIAVLISSVVLTIAIGIFAVITLGIGSLAFPLVGLPALIQLIFAVIGAVKANQGEWWNYPLNIRLFS